LEGVAVSGVDIHELDPVGGGMRPGGQHPGRDDALERRPKELRVLYHEP
jgi:hypothetical protein